MHAAFRALGLFAILGQTATSAAIVLPADLSASCVLVSGGDGALTSVRIFFRISNVGERDVFDLTPDKLEVTSRGTAFLFLKAAPVRYPTLPPGGEELFLWAGQPFGDGSVEVHASLTAQAADGSELRVGPVACGELAVGDPDRTPPKPAGSPHPYRTRAPTATRTPAPSGPCAADCDRSGTVQVHELVTAIGIAIGRDDVSACSAADADGDSQIEVSELVGGVQTLLLGCPPDSEEP